jgi:hypothetical protein
VGIVVFVLVPVIQGRHCGVIVWGERLSLAGYLLPWSQLRCPTSRGRVGGHWIRLVWQHLSPDRESHTIVGMAIRLSVKLGRVRAMLSLRAVM